MHNTPVEGEGVGVVVREGAWAVVKGAADKRWREECRMDNRSKERATERRVCVSK